MNRRGQAMLILSIFLLGLLITKSLYFDPVGDLEEDKEKYKFFAQEVAPSQNTGLLSKGNMLTYRVMFVVQDSKEGVSEIMWQDTQSNQWITETIEGQYRAKTRAYLFGFIPVKDIHIEGGIKEWKQH